MHLVLQISPSFLGEYKDILPVCRIVKEREDSMVRQQGGINVCKIIPNHLQDSKHYVTAENKS